MKVTLRENNQVPTPQKMCVGELYTFNYDVGTQQIVGVVVRDSSEEKYFMPLHKTTDGMSTDKLFHAVWDLSDEVAYHPHDPEWPGKGFALYLGQVILG
jgi:hypothetical protein